MKFFACFVLIVSLVNFGYTQEFVVKSVCIVPTDAAQPSAEVINRFKSVVEDVKHFYKKEMERHGFGSKTFRLQTDIEGEPVVQVINGKYSKSIYMGDTTNYAKQDLPVSNNLYVVLIADINAVAGGGWRGAARITLDGWRCGGCRGYAYIAERNGNFEFSTVAHELGHAFGLWHNLKGKNGDIAYLMWNGSERLDKDEARWLNKSPYFNRGFTANNPPRTTKVHAFQAFNTDGTDFISLKIDVVGVNALYQAQAFRSSDKCVLSWDELTGQSDTAEFMLSKTDLSVDNLVFIQFIDSRGNQNLHNNPITIPLQIEVVADTVEQSTKPQGEKAYLAIVSDDPNTFVPINRSWQWVQHLQGVWEKPLGGVLPPKPFDCVPPSNHIPQHGNWDCFFYSHANSLIVWDISDTDYNTFDTYLYLPNPCGDYAAFEVRFLADYEEIYNSGEVRVKDQGTHISFDIPEGTGKLALEVFDLGDPGCDHYILADPHLIRSDTFTAPSLYVGKTTTTWGSLKRRD